MTEQEDLKERKPKWYCMRIRTNFERKVKESLAVHLEKNGFEDLVKEVFVPVENVLTSKVGEKKQIKEKRLFPGYMFINCIKIDNLYIMLKNNVPNLIEVSADVNNNPVSISPLDIKKMKDMAALSENQPKQDSPFSAGDTVLITEGSFKDFTGVVDSVNVDTKFARVNVMVFNRETPIEMSFSALEKAS
jgi:transcriptional antiterminator NusG